MKFEMEGTLAREDGYGKSYAAVMSKDATHMVRVDEWLVDSYAPVFPEELQPYRGKQVRVTIEIME